MMLIAVAEAAYIRPSLFSPFLVRDSSLWYEMGSYWYLIRLGLGYEIWYEMVRDYPLPPEGYDVRHRQELLYIAYYSATLSSCFQQMLL